MHVHSPRRTHCRGSCVSRTAAQAQRPDDPTLALLRRLGNAALARLIRARLAVSQPDHPDEQEAERVAAAVTRTPAPKTGPASPGPMPDRAPVQVRRACPTCEQEMERQALPKEEMLHARAPVPAGSIQRQAPMEE